MRHQMHLRSFLLALTVLGAAAAARSAEGATSGYAAFREIFEELVETNTTLSAGSCTLAAERMATRLKAAGLPEHDIHIVINDQEKMPSVLHLC